MSMHVVRVDGRKPFLSYSLNDIMCSVFSVDAADDDCFFRIQIKLMFEGSKPRSEYASLETEIIVSEKRFRVIDDFVAIDFLIGLLRESLIRKDCQIEQSTVSFLENKGQSRCHRR